ncbi:MAG: outer membrane beta-barrel protein [Gammaproteobacteria bacterium]
MMNVGKGVRGFSKRKIWCRGLQFFIALGIATTGYADYETPGDITGDEKGQLTGSQKSKVGNIKGIRVRSFTVVPSIEIAEEYIDNVYRQQTNRQSDFLERLTPRIDIESMWSRHALGLSANSNMAFYNDHSREDYQNFNLDLHGRIDVRRNSYATLQGGMSRQIQLRGSPDDRFGNEPTIFYNYFGVFDYYHRFNRLSANIGHRIDYFTFNDVGGANAATEQSLNIPPDVNAEEEAFYLHNTDRNFVANATHLRLGYLLKTGYEAFIRGTYIWKVYDQTVDDFGYRRSSDGYGVDAGVGFDLTAVLKGDVFVNYLYQNYDDPRLSNTSGVGGGIDLVWTPTRLTTVKASFVSRIDETSLAGVSGYYSRMFTLGVDHELRRNIVLSARAGYGNNSYNGSQVNINGAPVYGNTQRNENIYLAGASVKYLINRNFYARAYYDFFKRDVNIAGSNYDWNRVGIAVGASY